MPRLARHKRNLTEIFLQRVRPLPQRFLVWDTDAKGLALQIRPNGQRAWKFVYSFHRRVRWYHIGDASAWGLADARIAVFSTNPLAHGISPDGAGEESPPPWLGGVGARAP